MKLSLTEPKITSKYPIEVPTNEYYSNFSVYRIWFGKHFFIWKGKSLLQSVQAIAVIIERSVRIHSNDSTGFLYNVVAHINRNRVTKGKVEVIALADFDFKDWVNFVKIEQEWLDRYKHDNKCLNNNFLAYVPQWMGQGVKKEFDEWMEAKTKSKSTSRKKGVHA